MRLQFVIMLLLLCCSALQAQTTGTDSNTTDSVAVKKNRWSAGLQTGLLVSGDPSSSEAFWGLFARLQPGEHASIQAEWSFGGSNMVTPSSNSSGEVEVSSCFWTVSVNAFPLKGKEAGLFLSAGFGLYAVGLNYENSGFNLAGNDGSSSYQFSTYHVGMGFELFASRSIGLTAQYRFMSIGGLSKDENFEGPDNLPIHYLSIGVAHNL